MKFCSLSKFCQSALLSTGKVLSPYSTKKIFENHGETADSVGKIEDREDIKRRIVRLTNVDVSYDDFHLVEAILPQKTIPEPPKVPVDKPTPSGWYSPSEESQNLPYVVKRNCFHEHPIFLRTARGNKMRKTHLFNIEGNIWMLRDEIKEYLDGVLKIDVICKVDEPKMKIIFKHGMCREVSDFLKSK